VASATALPNGAGAPKRYSEWKDLEVAVPEEEASEAKVPTLANFWIGVVELFAVLVPGAILSFLLIPWLPLDAVPQGCKIVFSPTVRFGGVRHCCLRSFQKRRGLTNFAGVISRRRPECSIRPATRLGCSEPGINGSLTVAAPGEADGQSLATRSLWSYRGLAPFDGAQGSLTLSARWCRNNAGISNSGGNQLCQ